MAPHSSPSFSSQSRPSRPSRPSAPAGRTQLNSPLCGPRFSQHPDAYKHAGSQQILTGTAPELSMQYFGAPPIGLRTSPQQPQALGRVPEHLLTRLQGNLLQPMFEDRHLAQLGDAFSQFFTDEMAFSSYGHDIMYLPNNLDMLTVGLEPCLGHSTPFFDGVEVTQNHMVHTLHPRSYNYAGNSPTDTYFDSQRIDAYGMYDPSWSPGRDQSHPASVPHPQSPYAPRTLAAGMQESAMTISGRRHGAMPTASVAYFPSPTLSADTRLTPSICSPSGTPLPPPSPAKRANKEEHIRVIDLFEKWRARQTGLFTEGSLVAFREFCVSELTRRGHRDVSRIFSKQPKTIVGTQVSRADRLHHRHEQTQAKFVCPFVGCGSQCTRMHNLNLHLGAHLGLTDRYCEGCDNYFSASSINRHKETCSGKKNSTPQEKVRSAHI